MNYYLGVDGGGTKTKFILCDTKGKEIASSLQGTSHYWQCGLNGVKTVMEKGLLDCVQQANIDIGEIVYVFAAVGGYGDIEEDAPKIFEKAQAGLHNLPLSMGNDTENALAGSFAGKPGINLIAGTGSIGLGKNENGDSARSGGWGGDFGGDEGSAFWLGKNLLLLFSRQSDHRDKQTKLYTYLKEQMKWSLDSEVLSECVVEWKFDRTKIAGLAKYVFALAEMGDAPAIKLFHQASQELKEIAIAIKKQLQLPNQTPVSYSGGVFNAKKFVLEPLKLLLEKEGLCLQDPILTPDKGSVILAMQKNKLTITEDIIENLKAS
ncbi:MAG: BadF/BadG/BcrA/BcrD ATPase family protein [Breznakia sp.]